MQTHSYERSYHSSAYVKNDQHSRHAGFEYHPDMYWRLCFHWGRGPYIYLLFLAWMKNILIMQAWMAKPLLPSSLGISPFCWINIWQWETQIDVILGVRETQSGNLALRTQQEPAGASQALAAIGGSISRLNNETVGMGTCNTIETIRIHNLESITLFKVGSARILTVLLFSVLLNLFRGQEFVQFPWSNQHEIPWVLNSSRDI